MRRLDRHTDDPVSSLALDAAFARDSGEDRYALSGSINSLIEEPDTIPTAVDNSNDDDFCIANLIIDDIVPVEMRP